MSIWKPNPSKQDRARRQRVAEAFAEWRAADQDASRDAHHLRRRYERARDRAIAAETTSVQ